MSARQRKPLPGRLTGKIEITQDRKMTSPTYIIKLKNVAAYSWAKAHYLEIHAGDVARAVPETPMNKLFARYTINGLMHDAETTALCTCPDPRYRTIAFSSCQEESGTGASCKKMPPNALNVADLVVNKANGPQGISINGELNLLPNSESESDDEKDGQEDDD